MKLKTFQEAMQAMNFNSTGLRVEGVDSGSSNVVVNLNYLGVTWAAAIRSPVSMSGQEFANQKLRTAAVTQYLADCLSKGIGLTDNDRLVFDGRSYLVDALSTKEFLLRQAQYSALQFQDTFRQQQPESLSPVKLETQDLEYEGPYFISKGAPAQETLQHSIDFADLMLRGLAALHVSTGATFVFKKEEVALLEQIEKKFNSIAGEWTAPTNSKVEKRIAQYSEMGGDVVYAHREVFLQQDEGRATLMDLVSEHFAHTINDSGYGSFIHGDAHGRNFIVVQFDYRPLKEEAFLDRVYVNGLFQEYQELERLTVEFADGKNQVTYREYRDGDENAEECFVVERGGRRDLHLIDPDTGCGINEGEKKSYVYDLATLSLSIRNWCGIHGSAIRNLSDLLAVYNSEFRRQVESNK